MERLGLTDEPYQSRNAKGQIRIHEKKTIKPVVSGYIHGSCSLNSVFKCGCYESTPTFVQNRVQ
jgi:hypothetical protein